MWAHDLIGKSSFFNELQISPRQIAVDAGGLGRWKTGHC
jgi:hypothetical protein